MSKATTLKVVFKEYYWVETAEDARVFLIQSSRANGKGHIYHLNIELYLKCDYSNFLKVESHLLKKYFSCKRM